MMRIAELSDLLSPILVKELRQGRRSRALVLLAVLTILAAFSAEGFCMRSAESMFGALYSCLSVLGYLIFPLMAHRSLVHELEAGSWDILQLTGLGPRRIIAGKLMSSVVKMVILSLAVAPFLLVCHFSGGTDLVPMALLCVGGAVLTGSFTVVALFAATLPRTRAQRGVVQIVLLAALALTIPYCVSYANQVGRVRVHLDSLLTNAWLVLSTSFTLFEAAAARLSMTAENYAWRPRAALLVQVMGLTALGLGDRATGFAGMDGVAFHLIAVAVIACGALGMATEADRAGPPSRRRFTWSLFAPGAVSGFRLTLQLLGLTTMVWATLAAPWARPMVVAAPAYVILYLSGALWISRTLAPRKLAAPDATRGVFFVLAVFGTLAPWIIAKFVDASGLPFEIMLEADSSGRFWPGFISPAYGLSAFRWHYTWEGRASAFQGHGHWVLLALAVLAAVATDRMLVRRARA